MSQPETRTSYRSVPDEWPGMLYVNVEKGGRTVVKGDVVEIKQRAIPWCVTHDSPRDRTFTEFDVCQAHRIQRRFAPKDYLCEFSTGGSKHKWWEDSE